METWWVRVLLKIATRIKVSDILGKAICGVCVSVYADEF